MKQYDNPQLQRIAANLASTGATRLRYVIDVNEDAALKLAVKHGATVAYTETALADPKVDAVIIASSTDTHADLAIASAKAGKAIFCEKPIDLSLKRVDQCLAAVKKAGVPMFVGFNRRFDPSFAALRATKECVIGLPARALAPQVVAVGNCSGRKVDKFKKFGLTPLKAKRVKPPLIGECFANLECKVVDTAFVRKYNLFVLEVVKAWIDPKQKNPKVIHHHGDGTFTVDGKRIKLKSRMP